ncbi:L-gulonolactone/D-arabinono-1,4-lactone oxidase [Gigaspora margarita]|uniref:L-gulonolactone/D-arabinono-1,4-lactone oxidase n=1 Tax=Gigaspora margarita TaxID=4874 RepID=A0A8H3X319_GIGMA|nr:L-gulonolactone/D-arabinono-1,4-lactone oxidase [Gigaspora margarita]
MEDLEVDLEAKTVTIEVWIEIKQLNEELSKHGLALSNLCSISDWNDFYRNCGLTLDALACRFWWFPHTDDCVAWKKPPPQKLSYIRDTLLGFHLLELILYLSRFRPSTVPKINQSKFSFKISNFIDDSYKAFCFDCLFSQYVNEWQYR